MPGDGRGKFPPEELAAEIISIAQVKRYNRMTLSPEGCGLLIELPVGIARKSQADKDSVLAGGRCRHARFFGNRDKSRAFLACAFRQELFSPKTEAGDLG